MDRICFWADRHSLAISVLWSAQRASILWRHKGLVLAGLVGSMLALASPAIAQPTTWVGTVPPVMDTIKTDSYIVNIVDGKNLWGSNLYAATGVNFSKTMASFPGATIDVVMQQCFGGGFAPGFAAAIPTATVPKSGYTLTAATNWNQTAINTGAGATLQNFTNSYNQSLSAQASAGMYNHFLQAINGYPPVGSTPPPPPLSIVTPDPFGPQGASRNVAKEDFEDPTYASPDALVGAPPGPNPLGTNAVRDVTALNWFAVLLAPDPTGAGNARFATNIDRIYNTLRTNIPAKDIVVLYGNTAGTATTAGGTPINGSTAVANIQAAMSGTLFADRPNVDSHLFVYTTGHGNSWTKPGGTVITNSGKLRLTVTQKPGNGFRDASGSDSGVGTIDMEIAFPSNENPAGASILYNGVPLSTPIDEGLAPITDLTGMIGTSYYWDVQVPLSLVNSSISAPTDQIEIDGLSSGAALPTAVTYNNYDNAWSVGLTVPEPGTLSLLAIGSLVFAGLAALNRRARAA
jgi:hypothetical protein